MVSELITAPLIVGIATCGIYGLFELFARRKERLAIIEKLGDKLDPASLNAHNPLGILRVAPSKNSYMTLRMACLLLGMGAGFLVGFLLNYALMGLDLPNRDFRTEDIVYCAGILLLGGAGLLVAFLIETRLRRKE